MSVRSNRGSTSSTSLPSSKNVYKAYTLPQKDHDESLFDDDEDLKSRYLEKEQALKRINEELEKKTSEIFKKIEKYRYSESPSARNLYDDEVGQGDAPSGDNETNMRVYENDYDRPQSASALDSNIFHPGGTSYFNASRVSSTISDLDRPFSEIAINFPYDNTRKRPATAGGGLGFSDSSSSRHESHTEASIRRAETARPIEGLEEKHQVRLQKATESVLKCVQSKLVNYEQRLADMHLQYRQKIQENTMLEAKVKALEEDRKRLLKSVQSLQSTTDKFSKSAENTKLNLNIKAQAFSSLKKEFDSMKRDLKQKNGLIQSLQTRLDRCSEENKRLKSQHQSTHLNMKQQHNEDRSTMEELKQRIIYLEQQKSSYQATLEKQAQLIKSLRSQKVSLTNVILKHKLKVENFNDPDLDLENEHSL